jgi:hypothetical protein
MKNSLLLFLLTCVAVSSCEKDIDIKLKSGEPKLVVDASIETGAAPVVVLSSSLNYFGKISSDILANSFVRNAEVIVSDGSKTHRLIEDSIKTNAGYTIYFYTNNPADPATAITGKLNQQYSLKINAAGKEYSATTKIPNITKKIDSLWWEKAPDNPDSLKVRLVIKATDPPGFGDYVRYFTKRNTEPFYPGFNSVFDDQVIDGTTYVLPVDRGVDRNLERNDDEVFFNKGDTAVFKLCNIDKATFDFWRTFEFSYQSIGNPFSSPTKVLSNISNGGLGYFGGYASQFRTIVIPR